MIVVSAGILAGCGATTVTAPVIVVPKNGEQPLNGIVSTTLGEGRGHFGVANDKIQCSGDYPFLPGQISVDLTAKCSDGRTAGGTAVKTGVAAGSGTMRMSDGSEAIFAYGPEALALRAKLAPPAKQNLPAPPGVVSAPPSRPGPAAPTRSALPAGSRALDDAVLTWRSCVTQAAGALAGQPEPAETVAKAAMASCRPQEEAVRRATSGVLDFRDMQDVKNSSMLPHALAEVMAIRAAREKLRPRQPAPARPAPDYGRT